MSGIDDLFERNRRWAAERVAADADAFARQLHDQSPLAVWIGCSDSRVPPSRVVGAGPGELFVHRNVANLVRPSDPNGMAVLDYAVSALGVQHVVVCGHDGCGGIAAVLDGAAEGIVAEWLEPARRTLDTHRQAVEEPADRDDRWRRLVELSVVESVAAACGTEPVRRAWEAGRALAVHGWVYGLGDGLLRDLGVTVRGGDDLERSVAGATARIAAG